MKKFLNIVIALMLIAGVALLVTGFVDAQQASTATSITRMATNVVYANRFVQADANDNVFDSNGNTLPIVGVSLNSAVAWVNRLDPNYFAQSTVRIAIPTQVTLVQCNGAVVVDAFVTNDANGCGKAFIPSTVVGATDPNCSPLLIVGKVLSLGVPGVNTADANYATILIEERR